MFFFWILSIKTKYLTFLLLYLGYSLTHLIYIFPSIKYKLPPHVAFFWPSAVVSGGDLPFAGHTMKVCADNECCGWWSRLIYLLALRLKVLRILPLFRSGSLCVAGPQWALPTTATVGQFDWQTGGYANVSPLQLFNLWPAARLLCQSVSVISAWPITFI